MSKGIFLNQFNFNQEKISIIGYPKLNNYNFRKESYDFGVCSTPSMNRDDILFILKSLSKSYRVLFRPHPSLLQYNDLYSSIDCITFSNPLIEDIKPFFEVSKKIISGNSGVLFESLYLKKTTFLWTESANNKFGDKNNIDRYNVLNNNYCISLNKSNFNQTINKDNKLNKEKYNYLFPVGLNEKNETLFNYK